MQFERISPTQVLVGGPLESVREAAWYALWNELLTSSKSWDGSVPAPLIDVELNIVSVSRGGGWEHITITNARFDPSAHNTLVSFESKLSMFADSRGKWRAKRLADLFERVLVNGYSADAEHSPLSFVSAPIADPCGAGFESVNLTKRPVYGTILAPKRGMILLCYGAFSLVSWGILVPVTLIYGVIALREYKRLGDPGDKWLVITGMVIAVLEGLAFLFLLSGR